jgi:hypothetical protein
VRCVFLTSPAGLFQVLIGCVICVAGAEHPEETAYQSQINLCDVSSTQVFLQGASLADSHYASVYDACAACGKCGGVLVCFGLRG